MQGKQKHQAKEAKFIKTSAQLSASLVKSLTLFTMPIVYCIRQDSEDHFQGQNHNAKDRDKCHVERGRNQWYKCTIPGLETQGKQGANG